MDSRGTIHLIFIIVLKQIKLKVAKAKGGDLLLSFTVGKSPLEVRHGYNTVGVMSYFTHFLNKF